MAPSEIDTGSGTNETAISISPDSISMVNQQQINELSTAVKLLSGATASAVAASYFEQSLSLIAVLKKTMPESLAISITGVAAIISSGVNGVLAYGQFINLATQIYDIYSKGGTTGKISAALLVGALLGATYFAGIPGTILVEGAALYSAQEVLHTSESLQRMFAFLGLIPEGILLSKEIIGLSITLAKKAQYHLFNGSYQIYQDELDAYFHEQKEHLTLETKASYNDLATRYKNILAKLASGDQSQEGIKELIKLHSECFWKKHWTPETLLSFAGGGLITKLNVDELTKLAQTGELSRSLGPYAKVFNSLYIKILVSALTNLTLFPGIMAEGLRKLRANLFAVFSSEFHQDRNFTRGHQLQSENTGNDELYNNKFPEIETQTRAAVIAKTSTACILDAGALGPGIGSMAEAVE